MIEFQQHMGNQVPIIDESTARANTIDEVKSLFYDPAPLALLNPDTVTRRNALN